MTRHTPAPALLGPAPLGPVPPATPTPSGDAPPVDRPRAGTPTPAPYLPCSASGPATAPVPCRPPPPADLELHAYPKPTAAYQTPPPSHTAGVPAMPCSGPARTQSPHAGRPDPYRRSSPRRL
ncbi:vegetative cell wall protein gp1-like [Setaria italica]|uniref:vegetative cell wall protein gp1-like n=1 Tax=Setaria italica TaxID=4555 RepID=UPI000350D01A|nr:vegetative cell wall protein gp1-like [Setaria italica]